MPENLIETFDAYLFDSGKNLRQNDRLWKICEPILRSIIDDFYHNITSVDELKNIIGDQSRFDGLKSAQLNHWKNMLGGSLDANFQENAMKIGEIHDRIGLDQGWYLASYAWILMRLLPRVAAKHRFMPSRMKTHMQQIIARMTIDIMITTSAYEKQTMSSAIDLHEGDADTKNLRSLAETVVKVNATSFRLAQLVGNAKAAKLGSQTISSAASQLVASVEQISVSSESAANEANESNQTARDGHEAINEATRAIQSMLSAVHETHEGIEELSKASSEIGQILTAIEDIADQTNLLALNATIEAARAGEAGKGFAVVASEVKSLASQTSKSTDDIARKIAALNSGMEKIRLTMTASQSAVGEGEIAVASARETMDEISSQVGSVYEKMLDISNILQEQKGATNEIAQSIVKVADLSAQNEALIEEMADSYQATNDEFMVSAQNWFNEGSDQALCEMAKIDHVLFKKRILDTVVDRGDWKSDEVPDHHSCRLGKWYDDLSNSKLVNHPSYKALVEPHMIVHAAGKQALINHAANDFEATIAELDRMNEASLDVVRLLGELSMSLDAEQEAENQRQFDRLTTRMSAKLDSGTLAGHDITIEDMSKGGVGIRGANLQPGQEVSISVGNDGPRDGVTRWASGDRAGIQFEDAKAVPARKKAG